MSSAYSAEEYAAARAALKEQGNKVAAARALGWHPSRMRRVLAALGKAEGADRDGDDPYVIKGVSTCYDRDGNATQQWVKTRLDDQRYMAMLKRAAEAMADTIAPVAPVARPDANAHLLTLYTFTDFHLGMLAWHKEGGADWDVSIAEALGVNAMQAIVAQAPQSDTAVLSILGDFLHWDGLLAVTPTHGHVLDADSRYGKVVDVAIRLIRQLVSLALQRHANVVLLIAEGNHDLASSLWLRKLFAALYEQEPRVSVHESELPYYAIEWGKTLLGFHHGHLKKNDQLPSLFAAQFREQWGRCPKVYLHTGHRHHKEDREHCGARVIQHTTMAARDAHASRHGYLSERSMTAYTYHRVHGEVGSTTVSPEMLAA